MILNQKPVSQSVNVELSDRFLNANVHVTNSFQQFLYVVFEIYG
jgi:hypothetical protein